MELWRAAVGMGELAESQVLDTITSERDSGPRFARVLEAKITVDAGGPRLRYLPAS